MPDTSTILSLPYIQSAQAQKHVTHNQAVETLDVLVQLAVSSRSIADPVTSPADGARYVVASGGTGAWSGHDGQVAVRLDGVWQFHVPNPGWQAWVADEGLLAVFDGTDWIALPVASNGLSLVGVNATADSTNRLSVSAPASLLNHEGAGHQLKINKNTAGDTASLLYQSGFSGRAEMGLAGTDDFSIKTSADGAVWVDAVTLTTAGLAGIGVTAPAERLEVAGNVLADAHLTPSDRRLKTAIRPAQDPGNAVDAIQVVSYDWVTGGHTEFGVIAQDLFDVLPQAVTPGDAGPDLQRAWSVDHSALVPLLIAEVQSLRRRVSALERAQA
nr:DUF2793 domain-containing protein [Actibacterium ureilyticum]